MKKNNKRYHKHLRLIRLFNIGNLSCEFEPCSWQAVLGTTLCDKHGWNCFFGLILTIFLLLTVRILSKCLTSLSKMHTSTPKNTQLIYTYLKNCPDLCQKNWNKSKYWKFSSPMDKDCQWLATGRWFSPGAPVSSTNKTDSHNITDCHNKTDCHNITEILLKVPLNTINLE